MAVKTLMLVITLISSSDDYVYMWGHPDAVVRSPNSAYCISVVYIFSVLFSWSVCFKLPDSVNSKMSKENLIADTPVPNFFVPKSKYCSLSDEFNEILSFEWLILS